MEHYCTKCGEKSWPDSIRPLRVTTLINSVRIKFTCESCGYLQHPMFRFTHDAGWNGSRLFAFRTWCELAERYGNYSIDLVTLWSNGEV